MQRIITIFISLALGVVWKPGIQAFLGKNAPEITTEQADDSSPDEPSNAGTYQCDGRIYCSQMTSWEEATFFLQNCYRTKAGGSNHDGIPCECQWCGKVN